MRIDNLPQGVGYWREFIDSQTGAGINVYSGVPYQRGAGIGSFFRSLFRTAAPIFRRAAGAVGKTALEAGMTTLGDIVRGEKPVESLKRNAQAAASDLLDRGLAQVKQAKNFKDLGEEQLGTSIGAMAFRRPKSISVKVKSIKGKKKKPKANLHRDVFS